MVLLPCGNCCKPSRCGAIRWDGWAGENAPSGDQAFWFDQLYPYYPQPLPTMPFEFQTGFGIVRVEESLIRFTYAPITWRWNRFINGEYIVLERSGPHDFFGGEVIELSQVVHDSVTTSPRNVPYAQPSSSSSAVPVSGYGYANAIKTIGTVTLRTSPVGYQQSGECRCICSPRPFDGADYAPDTYTLEFLNFDLMPTGPREVFYDGTSPQAGEPNPGASFYSPFLPTGSRIHGPPPTGFRGQVPGCNRYFSRFSSPIVLRRYQQSLAWYSDFISVNTYTDVARYVFRRCSQNIGNDMFQYGPASLECLRYYNGIGSNPVFTNVTNIGQPPCAWNREFYRANIGSYTQFLSQYEHLFGENGNPFARVIAGGTYAPEPADFPRATSVTVTLTSTDNFKCGGTYNMPLAAAGAGVTGVTFPATAERPAMTVSCGFAPGNRTCGCDDPWGFFIAANYGGNYPTGTEWQKSGCYSEYNVNQRITCTNNGKANQSSIFGGYFALVDCAPSATADLL